MNVLVLDDEEDIVDSLVPVLNIIEGITAYGAKTSGRAFEIIAEHSPRILLLDYSLKEISTGLDVYIQAAKIVPDCKAIIVTGNADYELKEKCEKVGVENIIEKPILLEDIMKMVEALKNQCDRV